MHILVFASAAGIVTKTDCIQGFAYDKAMGWGKCALLPVFCADFAILQDCCAHFTRLGTLSPHGTFA